MSCLITSKRTKEIAESIGRNAEEVNAMLDVVNDMINDGEDISDKLNDDAIKNLFSVMDSIFKGRNADESRKIKSMIQSEIATNKDRSPIEIISEIAKSVAEMKISEGKAEIRFTEAHNSPDGLPFESKESTKDFISAFGDNVSEDDSLDFLRKIAKYHEVLSNSGILNAVLNAMKNNGVRIVFRKRNKDINLHMNPKSKSYYSNNVIVIDQDYSFKCGMKDNVRYSELVETIFHEVIHHITENKLSEGNNEANGNKLINEIKKEAESLGIDISDYGFKNIHEALAELVNGKFREKLSTIKNEEKRNFLQRVFDAIVNFFNTIIGRETDALARVQSYFNKMVGSKSLSINGNNSALYNEEERISALEFMRENFYAMNELTVDENNDEVVSRKSVDSMLEQVEAKLGIKITDNFRNQIDNISDKDGNVYTKKYALGINLTRMSFIVADENMTNMFNKFVELAKGKFALNTQIVKTFFENRDIIGYMITNYPELINERTQEKSEPQAQPQPSQPIQTSISTESAKEKVDEAEDEAKVANNLKVYDIVWANHSKDSSGNTNDTVDIIMNINDVVSNESKNIINQISDKINPEVANLEIPKVGTDKFKEGSILYVSTDNGRVAFKISGITDNGSTLTIASRNFYVEKHSNYTIGKAKLFEAFVKDSLGDVKSQETFYSRLRNIKQEIGSQKYEARKKYLANQLYEIVNFKKKQYSNEMRAEADKKSEDGKYIYTPYERAKYVAKSANPSVIDVLNHFGIKNVLGELRYAIQASIAKEPTTDAERYRKEELDKIVNAGDAIWDTIIQDARYEFAKRLEIKIGDTISREQTDEEKEESADPDSENGNVQGLEESSVDSWTLSPSKLSKHESLTVELRNFLSNLPEYEEGKLKRDDIGNVVYIDEGKAFKYLLIKMQGCLNINEAIERLEDISRSKQTYVALLNAIKSSDGTNVCANNNIRAAFWRAMNAQFKNIKVTKRGRKKGLETDVTWQINKADNIKQAMESINTNIQDGFVLDKNNSVYNTNGTINIENMARLKDAMIELNKKNFDGFINTLNDMELRRFLLYENGASYRNAIYTNNKAIGLHKKIVGIALKSLGYDIQEEELNDLYIQHPERAFGANGVYKKLVAILNYETITGVKEEQAKSTDKVMPDKPNFSNAINDILELINPVPLSSVETSVRENKKQVNSVTNPSYESKITDMISKRSDDDRVSFIEKEYNSYSFFKKRGNETACRKSLEALCASLRFGSNKNARNLLKEAIGDKFNSIYKKDWLTESAINIGKAISAINSIDNFKEILRNVQVNAKGLDTSKSEFQSFSIDEWNVPSSFMEEREYHCWLRDWSKKNQNSASFSSTNFGLYTINHSNGKEYNEWSKSMYAKELMQQYFYDLYDLKIGDDGKKVRSRNMKTKYVGISNPIMSNAPAAEFFRIARRSYADYKQQNDSEFMLNARQYAAEAFGEQFGTEEGFKLIEQDNLMMDRLVCYYEMSNIANQEINRMAVVLRRDLDRQRAIQLYLNEVKNGNIDVNDPNAKTYKDMTENGKKLWTEPVVYYDISRSFKKEMSVNGKEVVVPNGTILKKGGAEFKFFPALNNKGENGKSFLEEIIGASDDNLLYAISNLMGDNKKLTTLRAKLIGRIATIQNDEFNNAYENWKSIGMFKTKYSTENEEYIMPNIPSNVPIESKEYNLKKDLKDLEDEYQDKRRKYVKKLKEELSSNQEKLPKGYKFDEDESEEAVALREEYEKKINDLEDEIESITSDEISDKSKAILREYFDQHCLATALIEELFVTDLAYYKDPNDFQKRYKQVYAPSQKLCTDVPFGRETEKTMYFSDIFSPSNKETINGIKNVFNRIGLSDVGERVADAFEGNDVANAQALRSPSAYRAVKAMAGELSLQEKIVISRMIGDLKQVLDTMFSKEEKEEAMRLGYSLDEYAEYSVKNVDGNRVVETTLSKEEIDEAENEYNEEIKSLQNKIHDLKREVQTEDTRNEQTKLINKITYLTHNKQKDIDERLKRFANDKLIQQIKEDSMITFQTIKPFLYTQVGINSNVDDYGDIKMGVQHKNSEFALLWATHIGRRYVKALGDPNMEKLVQLAEFMEEYDIDMVQFESAVKVGCQGAIDTNQISTEKKNLTKTSYKEMLIKESGAVKHSDGSVEFTRPDIVHYTPYADYGIQASTPEHLIDVDQLVGSQIRRLILADIADNAEFTVNGRKMSKKQYFDHYNAVITENILENFRELFEEFDSPESIERILLKEMEGNKQYTIDMMRACRLTEIEENGQKKKVFDLLSDPVVAEKIEALLCSIVKKRITKQKIKGGACIQVSCYGCEDLQIIWKDGAPVEMECYVGIYNKDFLEAAMDKNGVVNIDTLRNNVDKKTFDAIIHAIGYRVPTEDKYSMARLKIKGFLPPSNGSAIMLPKEITTLSGSDFDVDKMYLMLHEFKKITRATLKSDDQKRLATKIINTSSYLKGVKAYDEIMKSEDYKEFDTQIDYYRQHLSEIQNETVKSFTDYMKSIGKYDVLRNALRQINEVVSWAYNNKNSNKLAQVVYDNFETKGITAINSVSVESYHEDSDVMNASDDLSQKMKFADEAQKNNRAGRNNRMLDLIGAGLANIDTASKFLNPQSFDVQKKTARMTKILMNSTLGEIKGGIAKVARKHESDGTRENDKSEIEKANKLFGLAERLTEENLYNTLNSMSLKDLTKLADNVTRMTNPLSPWSQVYFHDQNAVGGKLIGAYANHNSGHSAAQYIDLQLSEPIYFNGKELFMLNSSDPSISKNCAGFLGASVDNVKDPLLNWLNQNGFTTDASMLMARLGLSSNEIGIFMSQPVIRDCTEKWANGELYGTKDKMFIRSAKEFLGMSDKKDGDVIAELNKIYSEMKENQLNINELTVQLVKGKSDVDTQKRVASLFYTLVVDGMDLSDFTQSTKCDTQNGAAKSSIAGNIAKNQKTDEIFIGKRGEKWSLSQRGVLQREFSAGTIKNAKIDDDSYQSFRRGIYNSSYPVICAFDQCGVNSIKPLFSKYFPQYSENVMHLLGTFKEIKGNTLTEDEVSSILEDLNIFWMSGLKIFGTDDNVSIADKRTMFINNFPDEFVKMKTINEIADNPFVNALEFKYVDTKTNKVIQTEELSDYNVDDNGKVTYNTNEFAKLIVLPKVGGLSEETKTLYANAWENMYYSKNPAVRQFAVNLIKYSYYRNGLGFGPDSFGHLAPLFRTELPGYKERFRKLKNISETEQQIFIEQYFRNHPKSSMISKASADDILPIVKSSLSLITYIADANNMNDINEEYARKFYREGKHSRVYKVPDVLILDQTGLNNDLFIQRESQGEIEYKPFISIGGNTYYKRERGNGKLPYYVRESSLGMANDTENSQFVEYDIKEKNLRSIFNFNNNDFAGIQKSKDLVNGGEIRFAEAEKKAIMSLESGTTIRDRGSDKYNDAMNNTTNSFVKYLEGKYKENIINLNVVNNGKEISNRGGYKDGFDSKSIKSRLDEVNELFKMATDEINRACKG